MPVAEHSCHGLVARLRIPSTAVRLTGALWFLGLAAADPACVGAQEAPVEVNREQLGSPSLDAALQGFWDAGDPEQVKRSVSHLLATPADFSALWRRLRQGRPYHAPSPRGVLHKTTKTVDGLEHHYTVVVPELYDPGRPTPVRFMLHGGVGTLDRRMGARGPLERLRQRPYVFVMPSAWREAKWWHPNQLENLRTILDSLKRGLNVDENRVHLGGISDGGAGAYFVAMRYSTPWATHMPLIAHLRVLASLPDVGGQLHLTNLRNKPFFAINTGRDPLYPHSTVAPYVAFLQQGGVDFLYHQQPEFGHNTDWYPREHDAIERFLTDHPRDPLPDRLTWTTERTDEDNRIHWLVIEELGVSRSDAALEDLNLFRGRRLFSRRQPFGRVDLERVGNRVEARTAGVRRFRLLLSPDQFDLDRPLRVLTNGRLVFEGSVKTSREVLVRWAARDNDRTMLFAAELEVSVP